MNSAAAHVSVEELASGSLTTAAREHLHVCAACRQDAHEWSATRDAVNLMIAELHPPEGMIDELLAYADRESCGDRGGRRPTSRLLRLGRERWSRLVATVAALLLVAGGVGYGISARGGSSGASAIRPALTMMTGCSGLESVTGSLQGIEGTTLLIRVTAGRTVRVSTGPATHTYVQQPGTLTSIVIGDPVIVSGSYSDGSLRAADVGQLTSAPAASSSADAAKVLRQGQALGTVEDLAAGRFTVREPDGTRVAVSTSTATRVVATVPVDPAQLQLGARTAAVGTFGPDGTMVSTVLDQQASPLRLVGPPGAPIGGGGGGPPVGAQRSRSPLAGLGCDPATVATIALIMPA